MFAVDDERDRARAATVYKSPALDLWSLGVILYRLLKTKMVYDVRNGERIEFIFPGNTLRQFGTGEAQRTRICPALSSPAVLATDVQNLAGCQQGFKNLIAWHLEKKVEDRITVDQALHGITSLFPELGGIPPRSNASASSSSSSAPPVNNVIASSSSSSNLSNNRRAHSSSGASSSRSSRRRLNGPSGSAGAESASIARKEQEANDEAIAKLMAEEANQLEQERARRQAAQKYKMHKSESNENQKA